MQRFDVILKIFGRAGFEAVEAEGGWEKLIKKKIEFIANTY